MAQGFSSMGEVMGATIYLTEILKTPHRYTCASIVGIFSNVGGLFALVVASFAISENFNFNWRYAFWIGAVIAVIGVLARTRLRETPEFANYKKRMNLIAESAPNLKKSPTIEEKVVNITILAFLLTQFIESSRTKLNKTYNFSSHISLGVL
jgi:MFS family permease